MSRLIALDVSTAPVNNAADFLMPAADRKPPKNYSKPESIAAWQQDDFEAELRSCGLDLDLACITGVATWRSDEPEPWVKTCATTEDELVALRVLGQLINDRRIVTYNGHNFDLLVLQRRAKYLNASFPTINTDRFKSNHCDLLQELSYRDNRRMKPLSFYVRRLGWTDLRKPLSGEEEARVLESGRWAELEQSLHHDITAIHRLSQWLKIWTPTAENTDHTHDQEAIL